MSLKRFIPGRNAFWSNMFARSLAVAAEQGDYLLEIEWPNGELTYEPAVLDEEQNRYICQNGKVFYSRGKGSDPKTLAGQKVIHVYAENAGTISTEHALMSTAVTDGNVTPVDDDGDELEGPDTPETPGDDPLDPEAVADGGTVQPADYVPDLPENVHGWEFSLAESAYHDPEPVSERDARTAVELTEAAQDTTDQLKTMLMGVGVGVGVILLFVGFIWLLGQLGGDGGDQVVSVGALLAFWASVGRDTLKEGDDE